MKQLKIGLIGAGERGANCYAPYALKYPQELLFTCVAEPLEDRRRIFAKAHNIPEERQYTSWEAMLNEVRDLDAVIVATQDSEHYEPTMKALSLGLHVLCEKPMAETYEKSKAMVELAEEKGLLLMVCHVLRYTPFFEELKAVIDSGAIGPVQAVHHIENIGYWHFGHSYVRGNWRDTKETTPMIVAKCSHDMDILNFLTGRECERLSSFGSLRYFTPENAPEGAADYCRDCPHNKTCRYSAFLYLTERDKIPTFRDIILRTEDKAEFQRYLEGTPYSRCVWRCDNDAVDRQTVSMEYDGGMTVSFTATAFTFDISRRIKIMGTLGELEGRLEDDAFVHRDFTTGSEITHEVYAPKTQHSGGDERIMAHFCDAVRNPAAHPEVSARLSLAGHAMAFAAEESRVNGGKVVEMGEF